MKKVKLYIRTPNNKYDVISICDEYSDEVLATAKSPELASIIKVRLEQYLNS